MAVDHEPTILLFLLACNGPDVSPHSAVCDTGCDSAASGPVFPEGPWPPLGREARWSSGEEGYGTGLAWADIDGDGDRDLVVAYGNDIGRGPLAVYFSRDGALESEPSWTSGAAHYFGHLAVGDVDGDGDTDVVVSRFLGDGGFSEPGGVQLYLNDGGVLQETPAWEDSGFHSFSCALGDLDNDGDLDLAVAAGEAYHNPPVRSRVYENDGGTFALAWTTERERFSFDVAWVDQDGDGWLDLAFANNDDPHTLYRNLQGALASTPAWEAEGDNGRFEGNSLDFGDVDGDGLPDLVVSDNDQLGGSGTVSLYCGPDLARCWESGDRPRYQSAVSLEDAEGDGDLDLFAGAWGVDTFEGDGVRLYENRGGALTSEPVWWSRTVAVAEAFDWDRTDADSESAVVQVDGLTAIPRQTPSSVTGSVCVGEGYATGIGTLVLPIGPRTLAVTNWTRDEGDFLLERD